MAIDALSELEHFGDGQRPWCDLVFEIVDPEQVRSASDRAQIAFHAVGTAPGGEIGFRARVPLTDWKSRDSGTGITFHWGDVQLCSTGEQTDRLLAVYEEWFDLPQSGTIVPKEISCTAVILGDDPQQLEKKKISMKLFFGSEAAHAPESYAELFLNFDLPAGRAWLREKDPGYRKPLADWLAGRYQ